MSAKDQKKTPTLRVKMLWERQQRSGGQGDWLMQRLKKAREHSKSGSPSLQMPDSCKGKKIINSGVD